MKGNIVDTYRWTDESGFDWTRETYEGEPLGTVDAMSDKEYDEWQRGAEKPFSDKTSHKYYDEYKIYEINCYCQLLEGGGYQYRVVAREQIDFFTQEWIGVQTAQKANQLARRMIEALAEYDDSRKPGGDWDYACNEVSKKAGNGVRTYSKK